MARYRDAVARDAKDAVPAGRPHHLDGDTPPATPSFPKKLPIILVSTFSTLLVGAAVVVTRELLSGRAYVGKRHAHPRAGARGAGRAARRRPAATRRERDESEGGGDAGETLVVDARQPNPKPSRRIRLLTIEWTSTGAQMRRSNPRRSRRS